MSWGFLTSHPRYTHFKRFRSAFFYEHLSVSSYRWEIQIYCQIGSTTVHSCSLHCILARILHSLGTRSKVICVKLSRLTFNSLSGKAPDHEAFSFAPLDVSSPRAWDNSALSSSSAGSAWDGRPFPSSGPIWSWLLFLLSQVSRQDWILCSCIVLYWSSALITLSNSTALKVHRTVQQFRTDRTAECDRQLQRHPDLSVPAAGSKEHPAAPQLSSGAFMWGPESSS